MTLECVIPGISSGEGAAKLADTPLSNGEARSAEAVAAPSSRSGSAGAADAGAFLPAKTFRGPKQGYVFKKGPKGTGYYLDRCASDYSVMLFWHEPFLPLNVSPLLDQFRLDDPPV